MPKGKINNTRHQIQEGDIEENSILSATKPVKKISKKEKRRMKKMQKYQQEDDVEDDWDKPPQDEQPPHQKKGKKCKKNKKKNKGKQQQKYDNDEPPQQSNNKKNKKNKKKNKKNQKSAEQIRLEKLAKLKEQRQQSLLSFGNNLMLNLHAKYADHFDDEMKETWEGTILEYVVFYREDCDDETLEDDEVFKEKKQGLREAWDEIMSLVEQDYEEAQEERDALAAQRAKENKIKELEAMGIKIGGGGSHQPTAAQIKAQKKREEKKKLKELAQQLRLQELDKIAVEQENKKKEEEKMKEQEKLEEMKKVGEEKKKEAEKAKDDGWNDDSSTDEEEVVVEKVIKNNNNNNCGKKQQQQRKQKDAFDESSDDGWGDDGDKENDQKKKQQQRQEVKNVFEDSDDEGGQKRRKRGGRKRKGKGGNGGSGSTSGSTTKRKSPKDEKKILVTNKGDKGKPPPAKNPPKQQVQKPEIKVDEEEKHGIIHDDKVKLRSPICVVMGHVDTGKTKILDHIRSTSVQVKEAGGITQQIGATYLSIDYIKERTSRLKEQVNKLKYKVPGLLFIDTPGHESFSNLRSRGSSMCDIAVLVVDLMHGLEPQTIESLKMLKERKCPLVVALNKIDVCYGWKADPNAPFLSTYNNQDKATKNDFEKRLSSVIVQFAEQGENAQLYSRNRHKDRDISLVPTSAITGEGIPDLLYLIVTLTKKYMEKKISWSSNTKASVLEVKQTQGYGATIDVIVSNGDLRCDDTIVVCGMNGPIVTPIRALLLPKEAQDTRVKGEYKKVETVSASIGVRIASVEDLSTAVAGAPLFIVPRNLKPQKMAQKRREVIEDLKDEVQKSFADLFSKVDKGGRGVFVQASTLGALEALIVFLSDQKIPICGIGIGTISRKTVMKTAVMLNSQPEYAVILAFNVKCNADARQLAEQQGVRIFEAEIIYHLQEMFENYIKDLKEKRREAAKDLAVFPVEMKILSEQHIFRNKNPLVLGVQITRGSLRLNTPICAQRWNASGIATPLYLGRVDGIKADEKDIAIGKLNDKVSIRIKGDEQQKNIQIGRSFEWTDALISEISRESVDALEENFEEEMKENGDTIRHLFKLKKYFNI